MPLHIGAGLILAVVCSHWFNTELTWLVVMLSVGFSLLPDIDGLIEKVTKGRIAAHAGNPVDHRDMLHKPLVLVPIVGILIWVCCGSFWATLATLNVFVHCVLDSFGLGWGILWLWPLARKKYKFFCEKDNSYSLRPVVSWNPGELVDAIRNYGDPDWLRKYLRSPLFVCELCVLVLGLTLVFWTRSNTLP